MSTEAGRIVVCTMVVSVWNKCRSESGWDAFGSLFLPLPKLFGADLGPSCLDYSVAMICIRCIRAEESHSKCYDSAEGFALALDLDLDLEVSRQGRYCRCTKGRYCISTAIILQ